MEDRKIIRVDKNDTRRKVIGIKTIENGEMQPKDRMHKIINEDQRYGQFEKE